MNILKRYIKNKVWVCVLCTVEKFNYLVQSYHFNWILKRVKLDEIHFWAHRNQWIKVHKKMPTLCMQKEIQDHPDLHATWLRWSYLIASDSSWGTTGSLLPGTGSLGFNRKLGSTLAMFYLEVLQHFLQNEGHLKIYT